MTLLKNEYMKDSLSLRDFQAECILSMLERRSGLIALPTGTGKTITAFSIYSYLKHFYPTTKLLYITEKPLILQTISQDLPNYFTGLKKQYIYNNTNTERVSIIRDWADRADILIINYAALRINFEDIGRAIKSFGGNFITILDEATAFKNKDSQISQCVYKLSKASKRVYAMTATPGTSGLFDIYNILTNIGCPPYKTKSDFEINHCNYDSKKLFLFRCGNLKKMQIGQPNEKNRDYVDCYFSLTNILKLNKPVKVLAKPREGVLIPLKENTGSFCWRVHKSMQLKTAIQALSGDRKIYVTISVFNDKAFKNYKNIKSFRELTRETMFLKSKKEIVKELPPVTVMYRYCDESKEVKQAVKELYESEKYSASQVEIATVTPQVYCDSVSEHYMSEKVLDLVNFLKNDIPDEKCIVYFPYTQTTKILKDILEKELETKVAYVTGETKDNNKTLEKFLKEDSFRVLLGTNTILKGLNLQDINYIAILHPSYTFGNYLQLIGRINRIGGSLEPKIVTHFITKETRDEDMLESVLQQGVVTYKFDRGLVDEGVIPTNYLSKKGMNEEQAKKFLEVQLEARRQKYTKKDT